MRRVRWLDEVATDIARALPDPVAAARFASIDWPAALAALARPGVVENLEVGPWPGGRLIVEPGQSVGAFSLFALLGADDDVLVIALDIWPNGFPEDPDA